VVERAGGVGKNLQALTLQGFSRWLRFVKPAQRLRGFRSGLFCRNCVRGVSVANWVCSAEMHAGARPRKLDEDLGLSEISACLQIRAIYRESTGIRVFHFSH
jgi:hypothetical protein